MKIRQATLSDIDALIQIRIDFLTMDHGALSHVEEEKIRSQTKHYLERHIPIEDFIAIIAHTDNGEIASAAFLLIQERPASPSFISGVTATLLNVVTYPNFRRMGLATRVIEALIDEAKLRGVSSIDLYATEEGRGVYQKLGFVVPGYTPMKLKL